MYTLIMYVIYARILHLYKPVDVTDMVLENTLENYQSMAVSCQNTFWRPGTPSGERAVLVPRCGLLMRRHEE